MNNLIQRIVYFQKVLIYRFNVTECIQRIQSKRPILIERPSLDEIKELNESQEMDLNGYSWSYLSEKIMSGVWQCIGAKNVDKIIGYIFFSTQEMSFAGTKTVEFILPPNAGYPFKLFVHPDYRNMGLGKQLEQAADAGIRSSRKSNHIIAYRATNSTNNIQIHNYKILGGVYIGSVTFIKTKIFDKVLISYKLRREGLKIKSIIQ